MADGEHLSSQNVTAPDHLLLDAQTILVYTYIVYAGLCQIVAMSGVVTNIINIICFVKQGFREPVNVSLLGLTISDLCCLISILITNVFVMPVVAMADLSFDVMAVYYLAVAMPHFMLNRVSAWITVIITLERCLCIIFPLQIKTIVTPKRMFAAIVCVYIILTSSGAPVYAVNRLDMVFSPWRNKTILGLVSSTDKEDVEKITLFANNIFLPFAAFAVIIVCTVILVISLRRRTQWRRKSAATFKNDVNSRNMRVAKMVAMISTLYISCFTPMAVITLARIIEPGLDIYGKYINITTIIGGVAILMECINSSANIFIYYDMSIKYRDTFNKLFCECKFRKLSANTSDAHVLETNKNSRDL